MSPFGVRRFEDLLTWQLAFEREREVFSFTATGAAWRDIKYREQIRDSSASATRNTSGTCMPAVLIRLTTIVLVDDVDELELLDRPNGLIRRTSEPRNLGTFNLSP